jgi:hypothetical protein
LLSLATAVKPEWIAEIFPQHLTVTIDYPAVCEGRLPVFLSLCLPDGKRLATTPDWPRFLARAWPKLRPTVAKKFPGHVWR